jgi:putative DNA primase/helicase
MRGDEEMVSFLQRVLGYALTGYTSEKKFFDAYGPKDTGKTTICRAFEKMLGPDYAHTLRAEALMHQRDPEKIPHELADLMGVRFVVVSEVPDDRRFNEELMKTLSGGDVIRACFKYANTFEFDPQLSLFLYSNERIELGGSDDALWERATSIPFTFNFKTETTPDTSVGTTLELPEHQEGILAWAVKGAVAWAEQGLAPIPEKVKEDTEAHRAEVNAVRCFLRERCEEGVGFKVAFQGLHRAYARWAKEEHQEKLSAEKFKEQMRRLGHVVSTLSINRNAVDGYLALQIAPLQADGVS